MVLKSLIGINPYLENGTKLKYFFQSNNTLSYCGFKSYHNLYCVLVSDVRGKLPKDWKEKKNYAMPG